MSRGRVLAYARTQLGDYALEKGILILAMVAIVASGNIYSFRAGLGPTWADGADGRERALVVFEGLAQLVTYIGSLFGANGIVSTDRQRGYYRLLFAQPVRVARFYAQGFVVNGAALVAIAALTAWGFSAAVRPVDIAGTAAYAAMGWLVIGGLGFLLSTLTHRDGLVLILLMLAGTVLHAYLTAARLGGRTVGPLLAAGEYLLPPGHILTSLRATFIRGAPLVTNELLWAAGFGLICLALGVLVLHRRPLAA